MLDLRKAKRYNVDICVQNEREEGQRLKKLLKSLLLIGVFGMLIFGLSLLVEGPQTTSAPAAPPVMAVQVITQAPADGAETPHTERAPQRVALAASPTVCSPPSDRNGHPLAAGPYVRVVYAAFPPEWRHG